MLAVPMWTDAMDLAQNPGHSLRLYLTSSSFSPPAAPCPGLASLWLGRGSGGAPFCFPSVFLPVFPPSLLVRCSSKELRARAKWVPILAQACDSVIGTSRFRIVCARFPENQQSNLQALLSPSGAKPPDIKLLRVVGVSSK